jgi:chorismate-pyruvate lyase
MSVERHPFPSDAKHAPLLRVLLALDGSTTRVCEAVAQSPITVDLLAQHQVTSVPDAVREQLGGDAWLLRVTSLHAHGRVMMDNLSFTRLDAVPEDFLQGLRQGKAPIGHLLQTLFVQREEVPGSAEIREMLWRHAGQPDAAASRSYRIVTADKPLMLIFEAFRSGMVRGS